MSLPIMIAIPCLQTKSEIRHAREPHPSGSILVQVQLSLVSGLRRNDGRKRRLKCRADSPEPSAVQFTGLRAERFERHERYERFKLRRVRVSKLVNSCVVYYTITT